METNAILPTVDMYTDVHCGPIVETPQCSRLLFLITMQLKVSITQRDVVLSKCLLVTAGTLAILYLDTLCTV